MMLSLGYKCISAEVASQRSEASRSRRSDHMGSTAEDLTMVAAGATLVSALVAVIAGVAGVASLSA
jgi:hypothetical protein